MPKEKPDVASLPKSRAEARLIGSKYYFDGKPCVHGHIEYRYTTTNSCYECNKVATQKGVAKWRSQNVELNKERNRQHTATYRKTPNGKAVISAHKGLRRASMKAFELSPEEKRAVAEFRAACPPGYQVDHIIPVNGKPLKGLHSLCNLQYLPTEENLSKNAKVDPLSLEANVCVLPEYRSYVRMKDIDPSLFARFPVVGKFDKISSWAQARIITQEDAPCLSSKASNNRRIASPLSYSHPGT